MRHADDGGGDRQAHGIVQQGIDVRFSRGIVQKEFLTGDFHGDDAEILFVGGGQRQFFEAAVARSVQRHLDESKSWRSMAWAITAPLVWLVMPMKRVIFCSRAWSKAFRAPSGASIFSRSAAWPRL